MPRVARLTLDAARPGAFVCLELLVYLLGPGCGGDSQKPRSPPDDFGRCASFDELRQPYFGDPHVHTALSLDANLQGTRPLPADAYSFAKGVPIGVQPYDEDGKALRRAESQRSIDFVMLSDHAEFLGTIAACNDPSSPVYDRLIPGEISCADYRDETQVDQVFVGLNRLTARAPQDVTYPALCGGKFGADCAAAGMDAWKQVQEAAEAAYDRTESCEFTSFVGYEWTAGPNTLNLHRVVMFRNEVVPDLPTTYFDEPSVEGLWLALRRTCLDTGLGCDVLAIPHNSNLAGGIFFRNEQRDGQPFDANYARLRNEFEPLVEVFQHKGASECRPGDVIADELCGFEVLPYENLATTNLQILGDSVPRDFIRNAYGEGMKLAETLGVNPFQHGIIAGTDTHIATPGYDSEGEFLGHGGAGQPNRDRVPRGFPDIRYLNPGGPAGVWAEENSRDAIFEAFRRKETFGTSGPRIVPRVFGGWDLPFDLCDSADLARVGYARGVPMGGELSEPPESATPRFVVSAKQDVMGAPLQRLQIVKGWLEGDDYKVEVFDVAGDANNGASVDLATCERKGSGFPELCAFWEDELFDPSRSAYYYVRVIENPTCRWSVQQCVKGNYDCENPTTELDEDCCNPTAGLNVDFCDDVAAGLPPAEADCCRADDPISSIKVAFCEGVANRLSPTQGSCCLPRIETAIQERAWTSPIWYQPRR